MPEPDNAASGTGNLRLEAIGAVTYEDDDGTLRRRYWQGDELVDEEVETA